MTRKRGSGEGSVFKRKDGRVVGVYEDANGKTRSCNGKLLSSYHQALGREYAHHVHSPWATKERKKASQKAPSSPGPTSKPKISLSPLCAFTPTATIG